MFTIICSTVYRRHDRRVYSNISDQCVVCSYDPQHAVRGLQLMSNVVSRCVCLIVCVTLGPKAIISRSEQNRYGWRRRTLLTARLIKFYGGLRRLTAAAMV